MEEEGLQKKTWGIGNYMKPLHKTKIVTFCGSTKFKKEYLEWQEKFTMEKWIVVSVGFFGHADEHEFTEEEKTMLDQLHLNKVMIADLVFVIDSKKYIGKSTEREIEFAKKIGKPVLYMTEMKPYGSVKMEDVK